MIFQRENKKYFFQKKIFSKILRNLGQENFEIFLLIEILSQTKENRLKNAFQRNHYFLEINST